MNHEGFASYNQPPAQSSKILQSPVFTTDFFGILQMFMILFAALKTLSL